MQRKNLRISLPRVTKKEAGKDNLEYPRSNKSYKQDLPARGVVLEGTHCYCWYKELWGTLVKFQTGG